MRPLRRLLRLLLRPLRPLRPLKGFTLRIAPLAVVATVRPTASTPLMPRLTILRAVFAPLRTIPFVPWRRDDTGLIKKPKTPRPDLRVFAILLGFQNLESESESPFVQRTKVNNDFAMAKSEFPDHIRDIQNHTAPLWTEALIRRTATLDRIGHERLQEALLDHRAKRGGNGALLILNRP